MEHPSVTTDPTLDEVRGDFVADDVQAVAEYRSVSKLAVASLLLGLVSAVALLGTQLLVVNLLGVICAVLALVRIARSEGQLIGRHVALAGLALSLTFGAGVYAHQAVVERLIAREAERWGLDWCELVRDGKLPLALELQSPPNRRRPLDGALADYYESDQQAASELESFRENPVVVALSSASKDAQLRSGDVEQVVRSGQGEYVVVRQFLLTPAGSTERKPAVLRLQLRRMQLGRLGGGAWFLADMDVAN